MSDDHTPNAGETTADPPAFATLVENERRLSHEGPPAGGAAAARFSLEREQPAVAGREIAAVGLLVALCDVTMFRGEGFAGYGLLFAAAPLLLLLGAPRIHWRPAVWITGGMLVVLAARLAWCGSLLQLALGFGLLAAFAMSLAGLPPYVLEIGVFASQTVLAGYKGLVFYWRRVSATSPRLGQANWLGFVLPAVMLIVFGGLFVLANPDLLTWFGESMERLLQSARSWLMQYAPEPLEILFWAAVVWISVGLLRPVIDQTLLTDAPSGNGRSSAAPHKPSPAPLYQPFRNTLLTVIALFAAYLMFELATMWFREFPEGFYYSGYAHQGAAWLTVALALATVVLSIVFRGRILNDPRLPSLRRLAWVWSLENMLLAIAVYNRLFIYIGFNGMTRMRMVGLFGISLVVAGFILVLWKIAFSRSFLWLLRRQLWALAIAVYLFALTPVDVLVVRYNVARILAGDPAPSVQISVHPISSEGVALLLPLLDCDDGQIREGVQALLAQRHAAADQLALQRKAQGWTAQQMADNVAHRQLEAAAGAWREFAADQQARDAARERFDEYAYQWY